MRATGLSTAAGAVVLLGLATSGAWAQAAGGSATAAPPPNPPAGWSYLPELAQYGGGDIFHIVSGAPGAGPAPQMQVVTTRNVGILTRDARAPLTAATTLKWRWNVRTLPSKLPETAAENHDYLSIAVKFDNGQDLTYMWSASLPVETGFRCPLPDWAKRETHVVIRSGQESLGQWLGEERAVLADYQKHIGGPPPGRITEVWLIANSIIQQGEGEASFADISLGEGAEGRRLRVF